ncbi:MAG TPA: AmmeMemoRadiSam system radical SAM enzyme [Elusimicrobiales bacterium]|nr:AmmeMemoRadiSam system radical SAM enzyme [Elusimicrobiales bacterium]
MKNSVPLDELTAESALCRVEDGVLSCAACAHGCRLGENGRGICGVRFARGGKLFAPRGYVSALACDPVEKKPFFHVLPGSGAFSFGMLGCNFTCKFCQNYSISQARDPNVFRAEAALISAREIAAAAAKSGAKLLVSTYNEPLITAEWAVEIFKAAGPGYVCAYVSNGYATPEAVDFVKPYLRAFKVDLKCFRDANYRAMTGGGLQPVLDTIALLHKQGIWTEVVTLLVPGFNDDPQELRDMARFLKSVSPQLPWHITAFRPEYKLLDRQSTQADKIFKAVEIGRKEGLNFVYAGNLRGHDFENTLCPNCGKTVVERRGFALKNLSLDIAADGKACCKYCKTNIPGIWRV